MSHSSGEGVSGYECPDWCRLQHASSPVFVHEGPTHELVLSRPRDAEPECLKVRTVEYLPLELPDPGGPWGPIVEVEHHVGDRYRVINLTSDDARQIAALLLRAASLAEQASIVRQIESAQRYSHNGSGSNVGQSSVSNGYLSTPE